jgi:hypothetical protein
MYRARASSPRLRVLVLVLVLALAHQPIIRPSPPHRASAHTTDPSSPDAAAAAVHRRLAPTVRSRIFIFIAIVVRIVSPPGDALRVIATADVDANDASRDGATARIIDAAPVAARCRRRRARAPSSSSSSTRTHTPPMYTRRQT